jgi:hypothetical protein
MPPLPLCSIVRRVRDFADAIANIFGARRRDIQRRNLRQDDAGGEAGGMVESL